jgi:hypothetical protein
MSANRCGRDGSPAPLLLHTSPSPGSDGRLPPPVEGGTGGRGGQGGEGKR